MERKHKPLRWHPNVRCAGIECVWTDDEARSDLISHIQALPASLHYVVEATVHGTHPPANNVGMDTAKVIQVGPRYYAVYSPNSKCPSGKKVSL